jgi:hypothetical protein
MVYESTVSSVYEYSVRRTLMAKLCSTTWVVTVPRRGNGRITLVEHRLTSAYIIHLCAPLILITCGDTRDVAPVYEVQYLTEQGTPGAEAHNAHNA